MEDEDKKENELSVKEGFRILSAYELDTGMKVWVITECLLPLYPNFDSLFLN